MCMCLLFLRPPAYDFELKEDEKQEINSLWPYENTASEQSDAELYSQFILKRPRLSLRVSGVIKLGSTWGNARKGSVN